MATTFNTNFLSIDAIRVAFGKLDEFGDSLENSMSSAGLVLENIDNYYEVSYSYTNTTYSSRLSNGDSYKLTGSGFTTSYSPKVTSLVYTTSGGASISMYGAVVYDAYWDEISGSLSKIIINDGHGTKMTLVGSGDISFSGGFHATSIQIETAGVSLLLKGNLTFTDNDELIGDVTSFKLTSGNYTLNMSGSWGASEFDSFSEPGSAFLDNLLAGDDLLQGNVGASNDKIYGLAGDDSINGLSGNDILYGGDGSDTLVGGIGNDTLDGGAGIDSLEGGAGSDTYIVDHIDDVVNETDPNSKTGGLDTIKLTIDFNDLAYTLATNVEYLDTSAYASDISLTGNTLANLITAGIGDDTLDGDDGNDTLIGGLGNDTLTGGAGADNLQGGAGDDTYYINLKTTGASANVVASLEDTVTDTAGTNDTLVLLGGSGTTKASTIVLAASIENLDATNIDSGITANLNFTGNASANTILGSDGKNTILGLAGADQLDGGEGDDSLDGGVGNDTLIGGIDNDTLIGGTGIDSLAGGDGDDTYVINLTKLNNDATLEDTVTEIDNAGTDTIKLVGSQVFTNTVLLDMTNPSFDYIENLDISGTVSTKLNIIGNDFDNILTGNAAANILIGGLGADTLNGGAGNDSLVGDGGDDSLNGGLGNDTLVGGDGNDYYIVNAIGDVVNETGTVDSDNDYIESTISIDLVHYAGVENIVLTGTAALFAKGDDLTANVIVGNAGANKLEGLAGNDTLIGFAGNDTLDGGLGADIMDGGAGNDTYIVDDEDDIVNESFTGAASGIDTIKISAAYTGVSREATPDVENIDASLFTGDIELIGNELANILIGGSGDDELDGVDGVDTLKGGDGDDTYYVDLKTTGTLTKTVASLQDSIVELVNQGRDKVEIYGDIVLSKASTITLAVNLEDLDASHTNLTLLNLTGNAVANEITGNAGANIILGLAGNDELDGGEGNDSLDGGVGDDVLSGGEDNDTLIGGIGTDELIGGAGNDKLVGGLGNDTLTGDNGADIFVFNTALNATTNVDIITDFVSSEDSLYLDNAIFKKLGGDGILNSTYFHEGTVALTTSQFLIYDNQTGNLFYDADGSGAGKAVLFAKFGVETTLDASDIQIV
ncbi:MAG: beta strand repeat-containing protein [Methylophilaceae bacterium]